MTRLMRVDLIELAPFVKRQCPPPCKGTFWCPVCSDEIERMAQIIDGLIAARVTAALTDLDARCCRAEFELRDVARHSPPDANRLESKRQGVALVRDYIRAAIPPPI